MFSKLRSALGILLLGVSGVSNATIIEYDVTAIAGNQWRYDYYVTNDSLTTSIDEFTIWFGLGSYDSIAASSTPAGWDSMAIQPDPLLPDDGFFDSLALAGGIAPGQTLGGFSAVFNWLGAGTPGAQFFDIIDPTTFASIDTGISRLRGATPPVGVPEPGTMGLMLVGSLVAFARRRKRRGA